MYHSVFVLSHIPSLLSFEKIYIHSACVDWPYQKVMLLLPPGGWWTLTEVPFTVLPNTSVTLAVPSATCLCCGTAADPPVAPVAAEALAADSFAADC